MKKTFIFGEPYWIRTNDTFLKSKLHKKKLPVNGSFIERLFRFVGTKCYNLLRFNSHKLNTLYTLFLMLKNV